MSTPPTSNKTNLTITAESRVRTEWRARDPIK
jgi:hypothetical protein